MCGWSWVLLRLNLLMIGVDPRTLRRYGKHAIRRLTEVLIYDERKMRREYRQNWLYTRLSLPVALPLFGRDDLLNHMGQTLHNTYPRQMQIVGSAGVGKSALVHKFIHQMIDNQQLDDLVWIQSARSADDIRATIKTAFLRDSGVTSLADYCYRYRVAVVMDNITQVDQNLLAELGGAIVIIIGRECQHYAHINARIHVDELDADEAKLYIRYLSHRYSRGAEYLLSDGEVEQIYAVAGGHPAKIRAHLDQWWCEAVDQDATRPVLPLSA